MSTIGNGLMINRRFFLLSTASAMTVASFPSALAHPHVQAAIKPTKKLQLNKGITEQQYLEKVNDTFLLRGEGENHWLTLEKVEPGPKFSGVEQFNLVFSGQAKHLPDDIYSVTHLATLSTQKINIETSQSIQNHFISTFCVLS